MKPAAPGDSFIVAGAAELAQPEVGGAGVVRLARPELVVERGRVAWLGPSGQRPERHQGLPIVDAKGKSLIPALVDCHTHLVYGGDRVTDFTRRARGLSYAEIAAEGGGIVTTVRATRAASREELTALTRARLMARQEKGILTSEIKSGYGLDGHHELLALEVVQALRAEGFDVEATLLAAHAVPRDRPREEWVEEICARLVPEAARRGLCRFVDVFVERGAYTPAEAARIFAAARAHGLRPRVHADQLTDGGGAELAAAAAAVSADHLERVSDAGIAALARAGTVGVLLPGALTYLGDEAPRLGRRLIDGGVEVAVATDQNPGSSPTSNLALMATLAVTRFGLTAEEALRAVTLGGAHALARDDLGALEVGRLGRIVVLDHPEALSFVAGFGEPPIAAVLGTTGSP